MASRFVILAPPETSPSFGSTIVDPKRRSQLLKQACQLRGMIYLQEGAIKRDDLNDEGVFWQPLDDHSWHLLLVNEYDSVIATLRFTILPLDSGRRKGGLPHVGLSLGRGAKDSWTPRLEAEKFLSGLHLAFGSERTNFIVVGGWAADNRTGGASGGAELALGAWAFARHTNVAGALCIATERHDAHGQLVRTGAVPIRAIESKDMYFDPGYGCRVGLLGFKVYQEKRAMRRIVEHLYHKIGESEVFTQQ